MQNPQSPATVATYYSGAGGLDLGFLLAGCRPVVVNDKDADAIATHDAALARLADELPWLEGTSGVSVVGDVLKSVTPPASADVVIGGPPCFVAGTLVLTRAGYRTIESVAVGDEVLTHRARWRAVTATMARDAASTRVVGTWDVDGVTTTDEHPFLALWNRKDRVRSDEGWSPAPSPDGEWTEAADLVPRGEAVPFVAQILPPEEEDERPARLWWVAGRFLACGTLRDADGERLATFRRENDYAGEFAKALEVVLEPEAAVVEHAEHIDVHSAQLVTLLETFVSAEGVKVLSGAHLALPGHAAEALLRGWSSVPDPDSDRALRLGLGLLAQRDTGLVSVALADRSVMPAPLPALVVDGVGWRPVVRNEPAGPARVFNLSVDEDESYVVENIVVHNCQAFSQAGRMDPTDPRAEHVFHFLRLVERTRPRAFVMENVANLGRNVRWQSVREQLFALVDEISGYEPVLALLDSSRYGVGEKRLRMLLVGLPPGARPFVPVETTAERPPSVREVLARLPRVGEPGNDSLCTAAVVPARTPVLRPSPWAGMLFNGQGRPMNPDAPAPTLPASMGGNRTPIIDQVHFDGGDSWIADYHAHLLAGGGVVARAPGRLRRITVEEAAAIQGFPLWMPWNGMQSSRYRQIGNAVPPPLAYAVAKAVLASLEMPAPDDALAARLLGVPVEHLAGKTLALEDAA